MNSWHKVVHGSSSNLHLVTDKSIDLVVTSPPYPMIGMWDEIFAQQDTDIRVALEQGDDLRAFEGMHYQLDNVWRELSRVVKQGGIVCINIGDATRSTEEDFKLWSNHTRITRWFTENGFSNLPNIIWRKSTNAPNKFMGSGMLPAGAYVTLEHEHILIFRKGSKRKFNLQHERLNRQQSAFFWEERNQWFSDLWELKGVKQKLFTRNTRERSAAFPFEIPYRLINMFSVKGDTVLDPFLGTGTTTLAALASARNSIGYDIDSNLLTDFVERATKEELICSLNDIVYERLQNHLEFVKNRQEKKGVPFQHMNAPYQFPIMTSQERELTLNFITAIKAQDNSLMAEYLTEPALQPPAQKLTDV